MNKLTLDTLAAARTWLQTEPGDEAADTMFKIALVRAGFLKSVDQILGLVCGQVDDTTVQVVTSMHVYTLDTKANAVTINELPAGFHVERDASK